MSTTIDVTSRVRIITGELESGTSSAEIIKKFQPQWQVADRTMQRYFAFACDELKGKYRSIDAMIEAQRGALIDEKIEVLRSNFELEAMLIKALESGIESEKVIEGPQGTTVMKTKVSLGELRRTIAFLLKNRSLGMKEEKQNNSLSLPTFIVDSAEQKEIMEKIASMP